MTTPTTPPAANHYVDNAELYRACLAYRNACVLAEQEGKPKPRIPDYIGSCLLKIATKLSYSRNFINYPYREEMIGDGIENCILYFHNFNPDKYKNPFSYFTQIIYYAFLRRIHREKKQMYVRHKVMMNQIDEGLADGLEGEAGDEDFGLSIDKKMTDNDYMNGFVNAFEEKARERRDARRSKKGVEKFFEGEQEEPAEIDPEDASISIDPEVE
jgi:hypothetical protein